MGPGGYVEAAAAARRRPPRPGRADRRAVRAPTRRRSSSAGFVDFDDLLRLCSAPARDRPRVRRHAALAVPPPLRRRVPGREPAADAAARRLAGRPLGPVRGRRPPPGHLRVERRRRRLPRASSRGATRRPRSSPSTATTARPPRCWPRRPTCWPRPGCRTARCARCGPTARPPRLDRHPTDRDEAQAVARAVRDARAPGTPWSAQAVLARTHAQLPVLAEALRLPGVPHRVRGEGDLLARPEVRTAMDLLRRSDRLLVGRAARPAGAGRRHRGRQLGLEAEEVANLDLVVRLRPRPAAARRAGLEPRVPGLAGGHAARPRAATGGRRRHAGHLPRRQGPGVAGRAPDRAGGRLRPHRPRPHPPRPHRGGPAAVRGHDPGRGRAALHLGGPARLRREGGRPPPVARGSPAWPRPSGPRPTAPAATGRPPTGAATWPTSGPCWPRPPPTARPAPTGALAALHAWREEAARAARVEPETLVDDRLLEAIAAAAAPLARRAGRHPRHGAAAGRPGGRRRPLRPGSEPA